MRPETLDHVALWVADRDRIADFVTDRVGMHIVDRTDAFTLVGSDARRGKLTLFAADGPRERGALKHIALRVSSLEAAESALRDGFEIEARVRTEARTGAEMEALHAVAVAALTVYDMVKAADKAMVISDIRLVRKTGGRSGVYVRRP